MNISGKDVEIGDVWEVRDTDNNLISSFLVLDLLEEMGTHLAKVWVMQGPVGSVVAKSQLPRSSSVTYKLVARL